MTFLAIRYLMSRPRQTFLMLLGIFFGTAAFVSISGFMLGFREYLIDQLINNSPHVTISAREDFLTETSLNEGFFGRAVSHVFWDPPPSGRKDSATVNDPQSWYIRLRADQRVLAFSPQLSQPVVFNNGKAQASASMIGCDATQQVKVTSIGTYMKEGKFSDLDVGGNRVILGAELMRKLGARVGQSIMVASSVRAGVPFKVVGSYSTGNRLSDLNAYASLSDVQALAKMPNRVSSIVLKVFDYNQAAAMANSWSKFSEEKVESWDQLNASFFDIFKIQDAIRFLSVGAVMVVAGFGIYNVLNMTVMQKRKDVAILKSMGYSTGEIVSLFFSQGIILGVTGVIAGLTFGFLLCSYLSTLSFSGGPMGSGNGHLMISLNPKIYLQATTLALFSATLSSILPAFSAGKLTPIEIIRAGTE